MEIRAHTHHIQGYCICDQFQQVYAEETMRRNKRGQAIGKIQYRAFLFQEVPIRNQSMHHAFPHGHETIRIHRGVDRIKKRTLRARSYADPCTKEAEQPSCTCLTKMICTCFKGTRGICHTVREVKYRWLRLLGLSGTVREIRPSSRRGFRYFRVVFLSLKPRRLPISTMLRGLSIQNNRIWS